jgi:hypothetical protein
MKALARLVGPMPGHDHSIKNLPLEAEQLIAKRSKACTATRAATSTSALFISERIRVLGIHDYSSDNRNFLLDGSRFEQLKLLGNLHHLYERA